MANKEVGIFSQARAPASCGIYSCCTATVARRIFRTRPQSRLALRLMCRIDRPCPQEDAWMPHTLQMTVAFRNTARITTTWKLAITRLLSDGEGFGPASDRMLSPQSSSPSRLLTASCEKLTGDRGVRDRILVKPQARQRLRSQTNHNTAVSSLVIRCYNIASTTLHATSAEDFS